MAHGCEFISFADHSVVQQKAGIDMKEGDLVSILNDGQYVIFFRSINGSIAIWVLSQNWVKLWSLCSSSLDRQRRKWRKCGRRPFALLRVVLTLVLFVAFSHLVDTYYHLKEYKLSLEYTSLYTYINKSLIPAAFQEEIGIPKLVYEIGDVFPFVASISHKYTPDKRCHDDSVLNLPYDSSSSFRKKSESSDDLHSRGYSTSPIPLDPKPNLFQNTKERFVQIWLNINERVSPSRKKLKEETRVVPFVYYYVGNLCSSNAYWFWRRIELDLWGGLHALHAVPFRKPKERVVPVSQDEPKSMSAESYAHVFPKWCTASSAHPPSKWSGVSQRKACVF